MKQQVVFDTNSVRSAESFSDFLGGRDELERFVKMAQLIIPELVVDEIKCQKKKQLFSKRDSFLSNPFHYLLNLDREQIEHFDMDAWIEDLAKKEKIPHKIITLSKKKSEILEQIKSMCLTGSPPFEDSTDKGFKDAYLYFTILEYLNSIKDDTLYVVTKDVRMKMALQKHKRIRVVQDYDEFARYNTEYFKDEYFIGRLKEEVDGEIEESDILQISLNTNENWVLRIRKNDKTYLVEVDFLSKEIISFTDEDYLDDINRLVSSSNFATSHAYVASLKDKINYFSEDDVHKILLAANQNDQIYWIAEDDDVKGFFGELYKAKSSMLDEDERKLFEEHFSHHD